MSWGSVKVLEGAKLGGVVLEGFAKGGCLTCCHLLHARRQLEKAIRKCYPWALYDSCLGIWHRQGLCQAVNLCLIRADDQWSIPQGCLFCSITFVMAVVIFLIPRDTAFLMVLLSFVTHCGAAVLGLVLGCPSYCEETEGRCTSPHYSFLW